MEYQWRESDIGRGETVVAFGIMEKKGERAGCCRDIGSNLHAFCIEDLRFCISYSVPLLWPLHQNQFIIFDALIVAIKL